mgnify:CR=1 FL=1
MKSTAERNLVQSLDQRNVDLRQSEAFVRVASKKSSIRNILLGLLLFGPGSAIAQKLPDVTPAPKGQTINMSLQTGSKSNLAFGTNTTFGASLSAQYSPGMTVTNTSYFDPIEASMHSEIGVGSTPGKTTATISNLKAQGNGPTNVGTAPINATDATFASGNAILEGLTAGVKLVLDPKLSKFEVEAMPNCNASSTSACKFSKDDGTKPYSDQQFANGSSNGTVNTGTTVDIGTTQFSSSFSQSF